MGRLTRAQEAELDLRNAEAIAKRRRELEESLFINETIVLPPVVVQERTNTKPLGGLLGPDSLLDGFLEFLRTDKEAKEDICELVVEHLVHKRLVCKNRQSDPVCFVKPENDILDHDTNITYQSDILTVDRFNECQCPEVSSIDENLEEVTILELDSYNVEHANVSIVQNFDLIDHKTIGYSSVQTEYSSRTTSKNYLTHKRFQVPYSTKIENEILILNLVKNGVLTHHDYISYLHNGYFVFYTLNIPEYSDVSDQLFHNIPSDDYIFKYSNVDSARRIKIQVQDVNYSYCIYCYFAMPTSVTKAYYIRKHLRFKISVF